MSDKVFDIQERCFNYSISIVKLIEGLKLKSVYQPLIGQIFRSATSVGANVVEGQHSHSKREMVRYYRIALKSGNETKYWLKILNVAFDEKESTEKLIIEINEITKILAAIIIKLSKKEE
jgi:four helix bundle protein